MDRKSLFLKILEPLNNNRNPNQNFNANNIESFIFNFDNFSPLIINIFNDYYKFLSKGDYVEAVVQLIKDSLNCNMNCINPNLINLFNYFYNESNGVLLEHIQMDLIDIVDGLHTILCGNLLEQSNLSRVDRLCVFEILDLFSRIIDVADCRVIMDERFAGILFDIFNKYLTCDTGRSLKLYNEFLLFKLLKKSTPILKLHSLESFMELMMKMVFKSVDFDVEYRINDYFEISPLFHRLLRDCDDSAETAGELRKRYCLLKKFILTCFDWTLNDFDELELQRRHTLSSSNILVAIHRFIGALNPTISHEKNWIALFLNDDPKLIQFLSYYSDIDEKFSQAVWSMRPLDLVNELLICIGYDDDLMGQWLASYPDTLGDVLKRYLRDLQTTDIDPEQRKTIFRSISAVFENIKQESSFETDLLQCFKIFLNK